MKATLKKPADNLKIQHRKENHFQDEWTAIAFKDGKYHTPVTARTYGTNAKNYACLWVHGETKNGYVSASGSGSAGGYGYHRPSAAMSEAITKAGFELSENIDGRGDDSIREAVKVMAEAMGFKNIYVHHANA